MKNLLMTLALLISTSIMAQQKTDRYQTPLGELEVTPINHGSVMLQINGKVIHIDPYELTADYGALPKAGLVLITHEHEDHYDKKALGKIATAETQFVATQAVADAGLEQAQVMNNGDETVWNDIKIEAAPAYNLTHTRPDNNMPFHPKGAGNGYVLNFGTFRLYIAGDTENIPEMSALGKIDIAFLPKNLPYTMDDDQFVTAAKQVQPKYLYPYHYFEIDYNSLRAKLPETIELK